MLIEDDNDVKNDSLFNGDCIQMIGLNQAHLKTTKKSVDIVN